jgi:3-phenylpropionate/trans-cinnamate dioxygenase ferredoxin subunit
VPSYAAGRVSDYAEGALRPLEIEERSIAIVRLANRFYAFDNFCTHEGVTFTSGYGVVAKGRVVCMLHSSAFDVANGAVLAGPAPDALRTYDVVINDQDVVVVVPD